MKPYLCPDGAFTALAARPPLLRPPRLLPTRFRRPILDFVGPPLLRASSHFWLKDYRISAELYEKSLLYLPRGIEDKTLRAKGFRVLCLCHLGLGQLDQAYEYIDEAQKLEPNVTCSFLKFKVYLQRKDHDGAIAQMPALSSCADFTVDFLYLSVHEKCSLTTEGVHWGRQRQ